MSKKGDFDFHLPMFPDLQAPDGFLTRDKECHALWYYFSMAICNYKDEAEKTMRYEGDQTVFNYHQLFKSVATLYNVDPNKMQNFWPAIDLQCMKMKLTQLPRDDKYRKPGARYAIIRPT